MQIINVSLAKAYENLLLLKFPDKEQNSLTFQSKQNSLMLQKVETLQTVPTVSYTSLIPKD